MRRDTAHRKVSKAIRRTGLRVEWPVRRLLSNTCRATSIATLLLLIQTGCDERAPRGAAPSFEERKAQRPWATSTSLEEGRRLHRERCLACHGQAPRELYTPARWREIVDAMSERSGLDTIQSNLVLDWILVGDSLPAGPAGER